MVRDHRPYIVKKAYRRLERFYVSHYLRPQLAALGRGTTFMSPWHVEIFGWPVEIGRYVNIIAARDKKVRLSVWSPRKGYGRISIADYGLVCPGVRVQSAVEVSIGPACMLAHGVYITDSDWHDLYDRVSPPDSSAPVHIGPNVWIGDSAIVCKGVSIGENSVIGAGAVVVADVPANVVAAGNPARVVKELDSKREMTTRATWYADPARLFAEIDRMDRDMLRGNTLAHWLRYKFFPGPGE